MQTISVDQLKARLDAGESIHLLDVREPFEHENFNIGGVLLPLAKIQQMQTDAVDDWKEEEVICYCRSGNRSGMACLMLETAGFTQVKNLAGGMNAWQDSYGV
jgi:rhodanese-related sulfurtransferase